MGRVVAIAIVPVPMVVGPFKVGMLDIRESIHISYVICHCVMVLLEFYGSHLYSSGFWIVSESELSWWHEHFEKRWQGQAFCCILTVLKYPCISKKRLDVYNYG